MAFKLSPEQMDKLVRFNRMAENVYTLDNILRVLSYSALYVASGTDAAKDSHLFLMEFFNKITDARFINRIIGLPGVLESLFSFIGTKDSSTLGQLGRVMTYSMIAYYPLEHVWWLSTLKPKMINIDSDAWSIWSCRAWFVYVVCDIWGTFIRANNVNKELEESRKKHDKETTRKLKKQRLHLNLWATCCLCDLIMAGQWSVAEGPFSTKQICGVGIYGGLVGLWLKWDKSRK